MILDQALYQTFNEAKLTLFNWFSRAKSSPNTATRIGLIKTADPKRFSCKMTTHSASDRYVILILSLP